jgi:transcriptional regulator GlxA family with amidase domain
MSKTPKTPRCIALAALPESSASVLYGLYDVLSSVGRSWTAVTGEHHDIEPFDVRILARGTRSLLIAGGIPVNPHGRFADDIESDIVIVPDINLLPEEDSRARWPEAGRWLRARHGAGAIVCSVCTGSVLLADAGLLDGVTATTHWSLVEHFRRCYPDVALAAERVLVPAGEGHRLVTSGGAGAWEELVLYLIARFRAEAEAVRTAKLWVMGDRSEGQLPFAAASRPRRHDDAVIAACQAWIAGHYSEASPVARMVEWTGLAERTFKRRFRVATGFSPVEYVQTLRIEEAKHLLETGDLSGPEIGYRVGYEDPTFFRRLFKRRVGVTPARYRRRFRHIGGARGGGQRVSESQVTDG